MQRQPQGCGTDAGYQRHLKRGEEPCQPCKNARNAAQNERRAMRRAEPPTRGQWTAEETRAAYTVALATENSPVDRRLLLEALGLVPSSATTASAA